ncbi:zinc finger FYVE-type containing 19 [Rhinolophus ferrumequinum]|uniref:Abscission/NoCut checkpoint regulator n=1 Tax=Rhinolophus ferrumequinum TaxID=59479 RepID=A0A7J7XU22_RHIFE|nr:zinc finger FYVE-type containing 19 [Rhinolophus ferrumequinum]
MESRCYGCAVKFTLFKKENGCKNCGWAFCSSCLSFSAAVPRAGNTQQKVCKRCYEVLTRGSSPANASKWSPPQNYKKRMAALEAKQKPATPRSHGLGHKDQVIAERLARLRQENKPTASIQNDLHQAGPAGQSANPKGQTTSSLEEKSRLPAEVAVKLQEENTRQEKILALTKRLAILRGQDPDRVTLQDCPVPDSDDDEETAIQRVLQQAQALAPKPEAEEELPWCCICNEDATLRCAGCDGDLYCVRCFREGHDAFELKEHQTSAYHPQHAGREY